MKNLLFFLCIYISLPLNAQILEPVKWKFSTSTSGDDEYILTFRAEIDDEWNVYSQHTGDDGPVPTSITFEDLGGAKLLGNNQESGHRKEGFDKLFETNVIKFMGDQDFVISQKVKAVKSNSKIKGYLTFMTCNDKTCLPPTDIDFVFTISNANQGGASVDSNLNAKTGKWNPIVVRDTYEDSKNESNRLLNPVHWKISKIQTGENSFDLIYEASIEKGWSVYSQYMQEGGPVITSITYENKDGIEVLGNSIETGHKKVGKDKLFPEIDEVIKFLSDQKYTIIQKINVIDVARPLSGYLTFMTCNDQTCLPPTDIEFDFGFGSNEVVIKQDEQGNIDQSRKSLKDSYANPLSDCGNNQDNSNNQQSLWWLLIAGILGGFAALLTPCVFPMIPITVSFFTKDTKRKGWINGLIYGLSIIVIYISLGLIITVVFGAEALNALSTNWIANTIFFIIFILFAFSFFGYYELTLPSSWTTKTDSLADKGGLLGIFFMATTLSLVSFSCTGPIVGSALVAAANGGIMGPLVVMLGFSAALALPFGLFAAFPVWLNSLPSSGGWMNSVKVVLGFLELGFAFKFLSTADLTEHWGILKYEVFMLILILVVFGIALYLFGFIKFPHDSPIQKLSFTRKSIATLFVTLGIYLCFGFTINKDTGIYNSLWLTSGFSPPVNYNLLLEKKQVDQDIKKMYSSYTKCANNINCFKNYFEGLEYAKSIQKPVFIDFTGHGCQNCRRTEDNIWVDDRIRQILNEEVVLVSLYVDDREKLAEPFVSLADGKTKRTVGNQWADFQVVNFQQNSQPLYIMTTPNEEVITHPRGYQEHVDSYLEYLQCGLEYFNNIN